MQHSSRRAPSMCMTATMALICLVSLNACTWNALGEAGTKVFASAGESGETIENAGVSWEGGRVWEARAVKESSDPKRFMDAQTLGAEEIKPPLAIPLTLDLTAPTDDLWERIRNGFAMPNLNDEWVLSAQQHYQSNPEYLRRMVERSRLYLHYIVEELEKRNMPMEIALLPMVESAYDPMALSSSRASGLWQFIPSTGRHYKLQQNWWRDERRDIVASTNAALDYLQNIYDLHGDWHLALASYNWGENAVGRALAKNAAQDLPTDYANLSLPNETRRYVPKLQALKNIFGNERLMAELNLPPIPNQPYFHTLVTTAPIDLKLAARFAKMSLREFIALNPSHNRPVIQEHTILVIPADRVAHFREALENHEGPLSAWQTYVVQSRESLEEVAPRFGITLADLKRVNGLHGPYAKAYPGQALLVPSGGKMERGALDVLSALPRTVVDAAQYQRHTVQKGDTLSTIARKYQMGLQELKSLNRLNSNNIRPGLHLTVYAENRAAGRQETPTGGSARANPVARANPPARVNSGTKVSLHTVQKGDTLFSIARRYKVGVDDLKRWNNQTSTLLRIGSKLVIQAGS